MPKKCCVPGCRSNYGSTAEYVSIFKFPSTAVERERWVQNIPRKDWVPSQWSVVCMKHFEEKDISRVETYINKHGEKETWDRCRPVIVPGAVPCLFEGLSTSLRKPKGSVSREAPRRKRNVNRVEDKQEMCRQSDVLEDDAENYMRWKLMGGRLRIKKGIVPHIFKCQGRPSDVPFTERSVLRKKLVFELLQAGKTAEIPKKISAISSSGSETVVSRKQQGVVEQNLHQSDSSADKFIQEHFDENQWEPHRADGKRKLKPNAIPTRFSDVKIPKKKQKFQHRDADEEVIKFIESLEAKKHQPRCVVCSRLLREDKKEYLSTLTSTTGLSLHQFLIGISDGKSTNIKGCSASDMVCFYCAHLINYADSLEAELVKLKNAINGCLEIRNLDEEDQELLKPQFDSHTAILDEYSERVVGPGSAAERGDEVDLDQRNRMPEIVIKNVVSVSENSDSIQIKADEGGISKDAKSTCELNSQAMVGEISSKPEEIVPKEPDPPKFVCQICKLETSSRSVLLFHLRRHMAHYKWCDFCDVSVPNDSKKLPLKCDPTG